MNSRYLKILLCLTLFPASSFGQEIPEPLIPTKRVTYGTNEHTSRDAIFFSEKDSQGNLIVAGYTERDFTFSDVKIVSLNENLEENWSDRLSWDGISYDYPIDLMIDEEDHVWVISKNYHGGTRANFVINRFSPSGEKLWEYKSPETVDWSTLNMNQYHYYFDEEGYLNFTYQKEQEYDSSRSFFRISATGAISHEYSVEGHLHKLTHFEDDYLGFGLRHQEENERLVFLKFNKNEIQEKTLDLNTRQKDRIWGSLFEENTQSFSDASGNYIYIGDSQFHDNGGTLHDGLFIISINKNFAINFFVDDDGSTDKYQLDASVNGLNEILILSNTQPIDESEGEPFLTLEKYSENGEMLFKNRIEGVTGNLGKIDPNGILVRTMNGELQHYDLDLNLLQSIPENSAQNYFHPQDIYSDKADTYLVGTTISKKYDGSDYNSEENFYLRKFTDKSLSTEYNFDGEGTSKYYNYEMIRNSSGDYLLSCREFYGPNNLNRGGSRAPFSNKVMRFNSQLEYQDQEIVEEDFDLWKKPAYSFEAQNGDRYLYEIDKERKQVLFYRNGKLTWTRTLNFDGYAQTEASFNNVIDREGNFLLTSSLYGKYGDRLHLLTPENDYNFIDTEEPVVNMAVLSNNWIFTFLEDYSIGIYSSDLKLISKKQYDENFFFGEYAPNLVEKNNKILLNVRHKNLVMVFDQYGDYQKRFTLEGLLHPSVAIFDENDALTVYHVIGQGLYTEHGYNWSRLAISRYGNLVHDYIGKMPDGDQDGDGVSDFIDECPNTTTETKVNRRGCARLELAADNYRLTTKDETCLGKHNGQFAIIVAEEHDYIVTLNGEEHEFRKGLSFEALSPGSYTACIEVKDEPQTKQCFEFEIRSGNELRAQNSIQNNTMSINVTQGTAPFQVKINGREPQSYQTKNIDIPVEDGDIVEVSSSTKCEGKLTILANISSVRLSSNPVDDIAEIVLPHTTLKSIPVRIFDSSSHLIISEKLTPNKQHKLEISTFTLPSGVYYLHIQLEKLHYLKLIKR